jgi:hypothetical protein
MSGNEGEHGFCSVPVRNVGAGLARILSARVDVRLRGAIAPRVSTKLESWSTPKRFLPSGEVTRIDFSILRREGGEDAHVTSVTGKEVTVAEAFADAVARGSGIVLHARYASAAEGEEQIESSFSLYTESPEDDWHVIQVFHSDLPEPLPL